MVTVIRSGDKQLWFGDYCHYRRMETLQAIRRLSPQAFCRYCLGPLPHTVAYCMTRGRQNGNPHLDPIGLGRNCHGLPDPIDPRDVADGETHRCMDGTIRRP